MFRSQEKLVLSSHFALHTASYKRRHPFHLSFLAPVSFLIVISLFHGQVLSKETTESQLPVLCPKQCPGNSLLTILAYLCHFEKLQYIVFTSHLGASPILIRDPTHQGSMSHHSVEEDRYCRIPPEGTRLLDGFDMVAGLITHFRGMDLPLWEGSHYPTPL